MDRRAYPTAWRHRKYTFYRELALLVVAVMAITYVAASHMNKDKYQIPTTVKKQLDFPVLFLKNPADGLAYKKASSKIATQPDGSKVFSFVIQKGSDEITIAEQAYPEALIYDKLTNSVSPYSEVGTEYGKLTLGRPADSGGAQVGVLKYTDSTLIFAKPTSDLKTHDWQRLFNSMGVSK